MAKETIPACKRCRREGEKLFLKGARCYTSKCAIERRPQVPGQHGAARRRRPSQFGEQLREKQKVRRLYGLSEKQFRNVFDKASTMQGVTGERFLQLLESRLDNIVFRAGLAPSRAAARQLVSHGHILLNGRRVTIPSIRASIGDTLTVRLSKDAEKKGKLATFLENWSAGDVPSWVQADPKEKTITVLSTPTLDDIGHSMNIRLIVEFYSR